ncbi:GNAT family N-acetyltransferase [Paracidobacterium acidisoli]|nr:GNAT family protein [Paracidobacterium acidisoli]MBT9329941.1 GNAT family N-acetyltransferase [Paracidobacterium acidisoli]
MSVAPVTLEGSLVRLEPLRIEHLPALAAIAFHPEIWRWMPLHVETEDDLRRWIEKALADANAGRAMPWITWSKRHNRYVGSTRFMDIDRANRILELGSTWIDPEVQRTGINAEAKYLQMTYAFEVMGAMRVGLKTHHLNLQSQNAMRAMGATYEGTLRNSVIQPDGSIRHSVWFSVISEEWPQVKAAMEGRLARHA